MRVLGFNKKWQKLSNKELIENNWVVIQTKGVR